MRFSAVVLVLFALLSLLTALVSAGNDQQSVLAGLALLTSGWCWITLYRGSKQKAALMNPLFTLVRTKDYRRYQAPHEWAQHDKIHVVNIWKSKRFQGPYLDSPPTEIDSTVWLCVTNSGQIIELLHDEQQAMAHYIASGWFKAT